MVAVSCSGTDCSLAACRRRCSFLRPPLESFGQTTGSRSASETQDEVRHSLWGQSTAEMVFKIFFCVDRTIVSCWDHVVCTSDALETSRPFRSPEHERLPYSAARAVRHYSLVPQQVLALQSLFYSEIWSGYDQCCPPNSYQKKDLTTVLQVSWSYISVLRRSVSVISSYTKMRWVMTLTYFNLTYDLLGEEMIHIRKLYSDFFWI